MLEPVSPRRGLKESRHVSHRFTVGYVVPSLRDFDQDHTETDATLNSSRHAKNLRVSSTEGTENTEKNKSSEKP